MRVGKNNEVQVKQRNDYASNSMDEWHTMETLKN